MVYPVWNYGYPAILKGFFDRVFLPGVSFKMVDGVVQPSLRNLRRVAAVTTYGGTWWRSTLAGNPPRMLITRMMRGLARPERLRFLALYDMNRVTDAGRAASTRRSGIWCWPSCTRRGPKCGCATFTPRGSSRC
jgi:putative NADPH-quinone reductase